MEIIQSVPCFDQNRDLHRESEDNGNLLHLLVFEILRGKTRLQQRREDEGDGKCFFASLQKVNMYKDKTTLFARMFLPTDFKYPLQDRTHPVLLIV